MASRTGEETREPGNEWPGQNRSWVSSGFRRSFVKRNPKSWMHWMVQVRRVIMFRVHGTGIQEEAVQYLDLLRLWLDCRSYMTSIWHTLLNLRRWHVEKDVWCLVYGIFMYLHWVGWQEKIVTLQEIPSSSSVIYTWLRFFVGFLFGTWSSWQSKLCILAELQETTGNHRFRKFRAFTCIRHSPFWKTRKASIGCVSGHASPPLSINCSSSCEYFIIVASNWQNDHSIMGMSVCPCPRLELRQMVHSENHHLCDGLNPLPLTVQFWIKSVRLIATENTPPPSSS